MKAFIGVAGAEWLVNKSEEWMIRINSEHNRITHKLRAIEVGRGQGVDLDSVLNACSVKLFPCSSRRWQELISRACHAESVGLSMLNLLERNTNTSIQHARDRL